MTSVICFADKVPLISFLIQDIASALCSTDLEVEMLPSCSTITVSLLFITLFLRFVFQLESVSSTP